MWSLPDIQRLNAAAVINRHALEDAILTGMLHGEHVICNNADENCRGSLTYELWFDVFSDPPKGIVGQCAYHRESHCAPTGYFRCEICRHLFVERYTHEFYSINTSKGLMCLPCAAEYYIANPSNWIELTEATIAALDFERVQLAAHVLAVGMPVPKAIEFAGNVEADTATGGRVIGSTLCERATDGTVQAIKDILHGLRKRGIRRALLVIDAAFQFSVSLGIYIDKTTRIVERVQRGDLMRDTPTIGYLNPEDRPTLVS